MFQLFESIKAIDYTLYNIDYHNNRINHARSRLWGITEPWDLRDLIGLPVMEPGLTYKCKVVYDTAIRSVQFSPYKRRNVSTFGLYADDELNYEFKYFDRECLDSIKTWHSDTDDIIIVRKGQITDCSFANLIFSNDREWVTPASPLLKGTKRQKYLDEKRISERVIRVGDLSEFRCFRIINAMIDMEECADIPIENIIEM